MRMANTNTEGGELEIVAFAESKAVNVHIFERRGLQFHRIRRVLCGTASEDTVHLLYVSRCHYDLLVGGQLEQKPESQSRHAEESVREQSNALSRFAEETETQPRHTPLRPAAGGVGTASRGKAARHLGPYSRSTEQMPTQSAQLSVGQSACSNRVNNALADLFPPLGATAAAATASAGKPSLVSVKPLQAQ